MSHCMFCYHCDAFRFAAAACLLPPLLAFACRVDICTEMLNGLVVALVYLCFYCRLFLTWRLGEAVFNSSSVTVL